MQNVYCKGVFISITDKFTSFNTPNAVHKKLVKIHKVYFISNEIIWTPAPPPSSDVKPVWNIMNSF